MKKEISNSIFKLNVLHLYLLENSVTIENFAVLRMSAAGVFKWGNCIFISFLVYV